MIGKLFALLRGRLDSSIRANVMNTGLTYGSVLIKMCVSIFTAPIFARHLSPYDFSVVGYFASFDIIIHPLIHGSFNSYYAVTFATSTEEQRKINLFNILSFLIVSNIVMMAIAYQAFNIYFHIAHVSFPIWPFMMFTMVSSYFDLFTQFLQVHQRMERQFFRFFLLNTAVTLLYIAMQLLMVVRLERGAYGRLGAQMWASIILGMLTLFILVRKHMVFKFDFSIIKKAWKFAYPLIGGNLLATPFNSYDRILLERLHNVGQFSLYNIGLGHSDYVFGFGRSLYTAFEPDILKNVTLKRKKQLYTNLITMIVMLTIPSVLYAIFARPVASFLTSGRYTDSAYYGQLGNIASYLRSLQIILTTVLMGKMRTQLLFTMNLVGFIACAILYNMMISQWGFTGGVLAKAAVPLCMMIFVIVYVKYPKIMAKRRLAG
jgi:O-antigen/teichoic acid export membrane protein